MSLLLVLPDRVTSVHISVANWYISDTEQVNNLTVFAKTFHLFFSIIL